MSKSGDKAFTSEGDARASKFYTVALLISAGVAAWIWWNNNLQDCRKGALCVPVNQEWRLESSGFYSSLNGLSSVFDLKGEIELASGDSVPVEVSAFENDDWSEYIDLTSLSIKGVSVTDYSDPITLRLAFAIPDLTASIGQPATLRFTGQVTIPVMEEGDDVISRTVGMDLSYSNEVKPVAKEVAVLLKPEGYDVPGKISRGWFWLSVIVSVLILLSVIGSRIDDPEEIEG